MTKGLSIISGHPAFLSPTYRFIALFVTGGCLSAFTVSAADFDWRNVGGKNFNSAVRTQVHGECWDFASVASLEAKYKITRNDPLFDPDISEQQFLSEAKPIDFGSTGGGLCSVPQVFEYYRTHGMVSETELPYYGDEYKGSKPPPDKWPLQPGWEKRVWKCISWGNGNNPATVQGIQASLKKYGPFNIGLNGGGHIVCLVGFHDDKSLPGGGYWMVMSSFNRNEVEN